MARRGKSSGGRPTSSNRNRKRTEPEAVEEAEIISETAGMSGDEASDTAKADSPTEAQASSDERSSGETSSGEASSESSAPQQAPDLAEHHPDAPSDATDQPITTADDLTMSQSDASNTPADDAGRSDEPGDDISSSSATPASSDDQGSMGTAPPPISSPPPAPKRGGMSALLGGVLAAGLGGGAVYMLGQDGMPLEGAFGGDLRGEMASAAEARDGLVQQIEALQGQLAAVEGQVAEAAAPLTARLDTLEASLADMSRANDAALAEMAETAEAQMATLTERMAELERLPFSEAVSETAIAAYEAELADLIASVEGARAELDAQMAASNADIEARTQEINQLIAEAEAARQEAARLEEAAARAEALANAQAELAEMRVAVSEGAPYDEALAEITMLSGVKAPDALSAFAAEGLPSLGALIDAFPDLARQSLSAARAEGEGQPSAEEEDSTVGSRLTAFLDSRLQTRSVVPREGNSADAVLSRAEAAVANGDLDAALSEIDALSEAARAPLADWVARATARRDALEALDALDAQLTSQQG